MGVPSAIQTVDKTGAKAGDILVGIDAANERLLLKVLDNVAPGFTRWIPGRFIVLDAGAETGSWTAELRALVGRETTARELNDHVVEAVRLEGKKPPHHVNVVLGTNLWRFDRAMIRIEP